MIDTIIFMIIGFIFLILIIFLIRKAKNSEEYVYLNIEDKKAKKKLKKIILAAIVGIIGAYFYSSKELNLDKVKNAVVKVISENKRLKIKKEKIMEFAAERDNPVKETILKIEDINYTEIGEYIDLIDIINQPYKSMGIVYKDDKKTLEKRRAKDREYLYEVDKRQYSGTLFEKEEEMIKCYQYINGFLIEYRKYNKEVEEKNLIEIKKYYKTGNERLQVLYEEGEIVLVRESYDKKGKGNYKSQTSYRNGQKYGEEIWWDNDGSEKWKQIH
ncbi:MAG: hypothetical protein ACRC7N_20380 [Clostridium sp.]